MARQPVLKDRQGYDRGFEPPDWWIEEMEKEKIRRGWKDKHLAEAANNADGRGAKRWDSTRIVKMRNEGKGTVPLVIACSEALGIDVPIVVAERKEDGKALTEWWRWWRSQPQKMQSQRSNPERRDHALSALDVTVRDADQTVAVPSTDDEARGTGSRRARRTPRRG